MRLAGLLTAICAIPWFNTATATAAEPLPYISMSPADGSVRASESGAQGFQFQSSTTGIEASVEVSSSPLLGQDGTLANDFQQDYVLMVESDAYPGTYRAASNHVPNGAWWTSAPGTYHWQIQGFCTCGGSEFREFRGPVRRIVVQAPSSVAPPQTGGVDLTIYRSDVRRYIRSMIRERTNGRIRRLRSRCRFTSYRAMKCRLRWRIRRYAYSGTARFLHYEERGRAYWDYEFVGKRRKFGCNRSARSCSRRLRW